MKLFGFEISRVNQQPAIDFQRGWNSVGYKPNWWQLGNSKPDSNTAINNAAVFTCVSILSQEIARLHIGHYTNPDMSGQVEMYNSETTRILTNPNDYQNRSDFFLQMMFSLLMDGNGYALATRDSRNRIVGLTPLNPRAVVPYVDPDSAAIYYHVTQLDIYPQMDFDIREYVPQRNMLHIRLFSPTHPLMGVSPLVSLVHSVAHGMAISQESARFFQDESKPAGLLRTPKPLQKDQAKRLMEAWKEGTTGNNTGSVPVLDNDLQFQQIGLNAHDTQLIEQYGMTKKDIAMAFRIPLYMVGEGQNEFKTAEAAQRDFITRSLGFYIEHLEANLDSFFGFNGRTEYIEFDVERGIMRPEYNERIEGLAKGVQGGIFTPNEARQSEQFKPMEGGDQLFMQRQNVPINLLGVDVMADLANATNTTPDPDATNDDDADDDEDDTEDTQENSFDNVKRLMGLTA